MDEDIRKKIEDQEKKLDAIFKSVEKTRRYFQWTLIISVAVIVLPLFGLLFAIPKFIDTFAQYGALLNVR